MRKWKYRMLEDSSLIIYIQYSNMYKNISETKEDETEFHLTSWHNKNLISFSQYDDLKFLQKYAWIFQSCKEKLSLKRFLAWSCFHKAPALVCFHKTIPSCLVLIVHCFNVFVKTLTLFLAEIYKIMWNIVFSIVIS